MLCLMDPRQEQRAWLEAVIAQTGVAPTTLAVRAGLAPTTLTRFLNDPQHGSALSARTISAVEKATGLRYGAASARVEARGAEADAMDQREISRDLARHLEALTSGSNAISAWVLRARSLETIGFVPGDLLVVDANEAPRRGDVVRAQINDWRTMKPETIFRVFEPPYLVAATFDRYQVAPRLIDKEVAIKGPVVLTIRPRASV